MPIRDDRGPQVQYPEYVNWSQFPVGTVGRKTKRVINDVGVVTVDTQLRLVDKSSTKVVIESQVTVQRPGMAIQDNPPLAMEFPAKFPLPTGMRLEQFQLPSLKAERTGDDSVKVGNNEYQAELFEWEEVNEAGPMTVKIWRSDKVPGRILRQETFVKQTQETSVEHVLEIIVPHLVSEIDVGAEAPKP